MATTLASEIIKKYQNISVEEVGNQTPAVIYGEMVILSAKLHEASLQTIQTEKELSKKWQELRLTVDTDGRTDKLIKGTDEYGNVQLAKANERTVIELIRSLKKMLQSKSDEARNMY